MRRTDTFVLAPTVEQEGILRERATDCAKLWNEATYRKRQAYMNYQPVDWECNDLYRKYGTLVDSSTAQQILRVLRNNCYGVKGGVMKLPKGLRIPFKGKPRWNGKQGKAKVIYDEIDGKWRVFQAVKAKPLFKPLGSKTYYVDLGVINLATIWPEGWRQPIAYSGRSLLVDWWYWVDRIAEYQSRLKRSNGRVRSKQLSRLYRIRQRRFRQAINAMMKVIVRDLYDLGVSKIVIGDLTGIRENNGTNSRKVNNMIHNFWSFNYVAQRLRYTAQEYGIRVKEVSEYKTSSRCIRCSSENIEKKGRLFRCLECGLEAHRDAIGVLNMANLYGGTAIRVLTPPKLLKWDGMKWEANRPVNTRPLNTIEARIIPPLGG